MAQVGGEDPKGHRYRAGSLNAKVEKMVEKMEISRVEKDKELKEELRALKDELHRQSQRQTDETERLKIETQHTTARLELEIGRQRRSLAKCMTKTKELRTLAKGWCERDLHVTSGAIWKWAVQMKKTPKEGKGKQLYTMEAQVYVTKLSSELKIPPEELKEMSRKCIVARSHAAHLTSLQALERGVQQCIQAIRIFPQLQSDFQPQCETVQRYADIKRALPDSFK